MREWQPIMSKTLRRRKLCLKQWNEAIKKTYTAENLSWSSIKRREYAVTCVFAFHCFCLCYRFVVQCAVQAICTAMCDVTARSFLGRCF